MLPAEINLQEAVQQNKLEQILLLLRQGVNINGLDEQGNTALYYAARKGNLSIVQCLVEQGANKNKSSNDGKTPINIASAMGRFLL